MSLVKFQPRSFEQTFNNLVDDLLIHTPSIYRNGATNRTVSHTIPANILKIEGGYELQLAAPGFDKEAIQVSFEKGLLTISAEHKADVETDKDGFVRREFIQQSFKRSWTLDETIDAEKIAAQYTNGVLKLHLPKKVEVQEPVKHITIQ